MRFMPENTPLDVVDTFSDIDHRPELADDAWISLPCLETATLSRSSEMKDIWCPQPGAKRLSDRIETKIQRTWKVKTQEVQLFLMQHVFGHDLPDGVTNDFTPNKDRARKGWAEISQYDHDDQQWCTHTFWTHMTVTGDIEFGDNHVQVTLELPILHSSYNSTAIVP